MKIYWGLLFCMLATVLTAGDLVTQQIMTQRDLKNPWRNAAEAELKLQNDILTVSPKNNGPKAVFGVQANEKTLAPDSEYQIKLEAKGNIRLHGAIFGTPQGRLDFFKGVPLAADWQTFDAAIKTPGDFRRGTFHLFCWEQEGSFDLRNFSVKRVLARDEAGVWLIKTDEFDQAGWTFQDWSNRKLSAGDAGIKDGRLSVNASEVKFAGFSSPFEVIPEGDYQQITLKVKIGADSGYANNLPQVFLTFYDDKNSYLGAYWFPAPKVAPGGSIDAAFTMDRAKIPANATMFCVSLASARDEKSSGPASGKVWFDHLQLGVK